MNMTKQVKKIDQGGLGPFWSPRDSLNNNIIIIIISKTWAQAKIWVKNCKKSTYFPIINYLLLNKTAFQIFHLGQKFSLIEKFATRRERMLNFFPTLQRRLESRHFLNLFFKLIFSNHFFGFSCVAVCYNRQGYYTEPEELE